MKIYSQEGSIVMEVSSLERDQNQLVIKGMVFQSIPMTARLRPAEARSGLRLLNLRLVWFLLTLLFRRDQPRD